MNNTLFNNRLEIVKCRIEKHNMYCHERGSKSRKKTDCNSTIIGCRKKLLRRKILYSHFSSITWENYSWNMLGNLWRTCFIRHAQTHSRMQSSLNSGCHGFSNFLVIFLSTKLLQVPVYERKVNLGGAIQVTTAYTLKHIDIRISCTLEVTTFQNIDTDDDTS